MDSLRNESWIVRRLRQAIEVGFYHAYERVKVDPAKYLAFLRRAHGLPIESFRDVFSVPMDVLDDIANQTIRGAMKFAAFEGTGLGAGGGLTILPDVGFLSGIAVRTIQKLSLIYGFEFSTDEEKADLWIAAASAAGVDLGKGVLEKQVIERFVPRIIERIAAQLSAEMAEQWVARVVPVVSAATAGALNYFFIRHWGKRAQRHFHQRHETLRRRLVEAPPSLYSPQLPMASHN